MEIYSKNSFSSVYKSFLKDFRGKLLKELGDGTIEYDFLVTYDEETNSFWVSDYNTEEVTKTVNGVTTTEVVNVGNPIGGHYEIYGLRRGIDENTGMPDKNLYQLEAGSVLTPVYWATKSDGTEEMIEGTPVTVTKESDLYFDELSETTFYLDFRFIDFSYRTYQTDYFQVE